MCEGVREGAPDATETLRRAGVRRGRCGSFESRSWSRRDFFVGLKKRRMTRSVLRRDQRCSMEGIGEGSTYMVVGT